MKAYALHATEEAYHPPPLTESMSASSLLPSETSSVPSSQEPEYPHSSSQEEHHNTLIVQIEDAFQRIMDIADVSQATSVSLPTRSENKARYNAMTVPRPALQATTIPEESPSPSALQLQQNAGRMATTMSDPSTATELAAQDEATAQSLMSETAPDAPPFGQRRSPSVPEQSSVSPLPPPQPLHSGSPTEIPPDQSGFHSQLEAFAAQQASLQGTIETSKAEIMELRRNLRRFRADLQEDAFSTQAALNQETNLPDETVRAQHTRNARLRESIASMEDLDRRLTTMLTQSNTEEDAQHWLSSEPIPDVQVSRSDSMGDNRQGNVPTGPHRQVGPGAPMADGDWSLTDARLPDYAEAPWYARLQSERFQNGHDTA